MATAEETQANTRNHSIPPRLDTAYTPVEVAVVVVAVASTNK